MFSNCFYSFCYKMEENFSNDDSNFRTHKKLIHSKTKILHDKRKNWNSYHTQKMNPRNLKQLLKKKGQYQTEKKKKKGKGYENTIHRKGYKNDFQKCL